MSLPTLTRLHLPILTHSLASPVAVVVDVVVVVVDVVVVVVVSRADAGHLCFLQRRGVQLVGRHGQVTQQQHSPSPHPHTLHTHTPANFIDFVHVFIFICSLLYFIYSLVIYSLVILWYHHRGQFASNLFH